MIHTALDNRVFKIFINLLEIFNYDYLSEKTSKRIENLLLFPSSVRYN